MRVFIFGGSGLIGSAVTRALADAGHEPIGLARSEASAGKICAAGGTPVHGDATDPASWFAHVLQADAIIQAAADFSGDPAEAEEVIIETLLSERKRLGSKRFVYTGGCWLYPERTDPPLSEADAFEPLPPFEYMVRNRERLLVADYDLVTVHPAIVWREGSGFLAEYAGSITQGSKIEVVGSLSTLWPLVHADDIAELYRLALEKGRHGQDYLGVADPGVAVGAIIEQVESEVNATGRVTVVPVEEAIASHGSWIAGQARSQRIETHKAKDDLGWSPSILFMDRKC
ncbi:MAG: NAD-dependent epimerase/dehydratase family protein [Parvularcula sp.]|jgi:nucleoside-diphosphate-sugar epimerase|nr:NAD-dependent epimerase/dehydratase family protein [Parvularcula sp.]